MLRISTAGSVDAGKSTLIGRLLYDSKSVFEDQLEAIAVSSQRWGEAGVNLALLTDGLRAEREQGITIDVAYRYFTTPRRKFILADTPGHVEYTRNMVTGASTADVAVILIDAGKGITEQTYRHSHVAALLRVPHVVVAINKMDQLEWRADAFDAIRAQYAALARSLALGNVQYIPMSALLGDNIVERSANMPWYAGPALLEHLEAVPGLDGRELPARFPVQWVVQHADFRGFAGTVAGGTFHVGDEVVVLPVGVMTRIQAISTYDGELPEAPSSLAVTLRLADAIDVARGDMIAAAGAPPRVLTEFEATVCWLHERPLEAGRTYALKHGTRETRAVVREIVHKVDIRTFAADAADKHVGMNDIARIRVQTTNPLFADLYRENRATGSFILIDEMTHATVGAGMIES